MNGSVSDPRLRMIRLSAASVTMHDINANHTQPANHGIWTQASGVASGVLARLPFSMARPTTGQHLNAT